MLQQQQQQCLVSLARTLAICTCNQSIAAAHLACIWRATSDSNLANRLHIFNSSRFNLILNAFVDDDGDDDDDDDDKIKCTTNLNERSEKKGQTSFFDRC